MERRSSPAALRIAALGALAAALSACATRPPEPPPRAGVEIREVRIEALGPDRVRFAFEVRASNPGSRALSGLSLDCRLEAGGVPVSIEADGPASPGTGGYGPFTLGPGEERVRTFQGTADLAAPPDSGPASGAPGEPGADEAPWTISASLSASGPDGLSVEVGSARAEGTVPRIREPVLEIRSIVLVRHELVNVLLELVLDVENPNPFPVEFSAASYRFHGEGRKWASGTVDRAVAIPARGKAEVRLPILLNFTETGRDLFDLVAKLRVVRFRLEGQARVTSPLSFLPEFRMDFDRSGAVRVERTLPAGP